MSNKSTIEHRVRRSDGVRRVFQVALKWLECVFFSLVQHEEASSLRATWRLQINGTGAPQASSSWREIRDLSCDAAKERRWCNAPFRIDVEKRPECKYLFGTKLVWTTRTHWSCELLNTVALTFLRHTLNRLAPTPLTTTATTVGQLQHWSPLDGLSRATNLY